LSFFTLKTVFKNILYSRIYSQVWPEKDK